MVPEEGSLHQSGYWWPHIQCLTYFLAPLQGAELLLQAGAVKPLLWDGQGNQFVLQAPTMQCLLRDPTILLSVYPCH